MVLTEKVKLSLQRGCDLHCGQDGDRQSWHNAMSKYVTQGLEQPTSHVHPTHIYVLVINLLQDEHNICRNKYR